MLEERDRTQIYYRDPLQIIANSREDIEAQLRCAANRVGSDVLIGREVVLWGGKFAGGVGLEVHNRVRIYDYCRLVIDQLSSASGIVLEEDVAINFGCYIDGSGGIRIRKRSILGPHVTILSSSHRIDPDTPVRHSGRDVAPVDIGEDVWIGANAVIRGGITVGNRAVIGAGSIVTHDVQPGTVVAGNPARLLRSTEVSTT